MFFVKNLLDIMFSLNSESISSIISSVPEILCHWALVQSLQWVSKSLGIVLGVLCAINVYVS